MIKKTILVMIFTLLGPLLASSDSYRHDRFGIFRFTLPPGWQMVDKSVAPDSIVEAFRSDESAGVIISSQPFAGVSAETALSVALGAKMKEYDLLGVDYRVVEDESFRILLKARAKAIHGSVGPMVLRCLFSEKPGDRVFTFQSWYVKTIPAGKRDVDSILDSVGHK